MMRSGSRVCLGRGLCIYTETPESPQYNATMAEPAFLHICVFAPLRSRVCAGSPVCVCVWLLLILCRTNSSMWSNAPVSGCMHVCVCACLLCRCGDRMSDRRSYIRLSVGLWFRRLVESFNISTEDCHLIMHPKQIHLARERSEL